MFLSIALQFTGETGVANIVIIFNYKILFLKHYTKQR